MAAKWGQPPWIIERDCTQWWWDWYVANNDAEAAIATQKLNEMTRRGLKNG